MTSSDKPRVIKDYEKLSEEMLESIKLVFPKGYRRHLVEFTGLDGKKRKGLPFETEDKYYLIRMTVEEAISVIKEDDDFDKDGNLKESVQEKLSIKYDDDDNLSDFNSNDDNEFGDDLGYTEGELNDDSSDEI